MRNGDEAGLGGIRISGNLSLVDIRPVSGKGLIYSFTVADIADSAAVDVDVLYYFVLLEEATNRTAFQRIVREQTECSHAGPHDP